MKYSNSKENFIEMLRNIGIVGDVISTDEKMLKFKSKDGGIINLFSNGTVQIQGPEPDKSYIKNKLDHALSVVLYDLPQANIDGVREDIKDRKNKKVFVVYGHDTTAREQLELVLLKLGLDPFVLSNTSGGGNTIIEALENEILNPNKDCEFGIVLMTPDDMGYAISEGTDKIQPRARQNVVLEMGMLLSTLKRERVVILKKGHLEAPSDTNGIIYLPFNTHVKETVPKLVQRLSSVGFEFTHDQISRASS